MKLLVLAQTPPPLHGQSLMVQTLVTGLPAHGIALDHVNLRLSESNTEIGQWRWRKVWLTFVAALRAIWHRWWRGCDTLYYVPAPGKRGALYRDWMILLLCRPFFPRLVLHWHAAGLAGWLREHATGLERWISHQLLGEPDLSITLAPELQADAEAFASRQIEIVANGIADPGPPPPREPHHPFRVVFLGLCREEKGVFTAIDATLAANQGSKAPLFALTVAGAFDCEATQSRFDELARQNPGVVTYAGFVTPEARDTLLAEADLLCLPSWYEAEAQPLVLLEALSRDRPIVATDWRGIPSVVTADIGVLVPPRDTVALAEAFRRLRAAPPAPRACRRRYEEKFTAEIHLANLARALRSAT